MHLCSQKQPSIRALKYAAICSEICSENVQQIYRRIPCRTPMPKYNLQSNFIEILLWHGCFYVNLLHVFGTTFPKNTSGGLLSCLVSYSYFETSIKLIQYFLLTSSRTSQCLYHKRRV